MKVLFEFSGEHDTLPMAELKAVLEAESPGSKLIANGERTATVEMAEPDIAALGKRLALARNINELVCSSKSFGGLLGKITGTRLPAGTFSVRAVRYIDNVENNVENEYASQQIAKKAGDIMSKMNRVDLTRPDLEYRIIYDGQYALCLKKTHVPRSGFETRTPQKRPFFSPVSIHPRLARVLVNLSRVKSGETLLDPFCGTGGVLIEAGLIGAIAIGNDIQERMVRGCRENLAHFGLNAQLFCGDVGGISKHVGKVDAIATDPPYGRAATTARESVASLYRRTFDAAAGILKKNGYISIVLPSPDVKKLGGGHFTLQECHRMRVHRSLTRYFCVYRAE